jgi:hypothetical protein
VALALRSPVAGSGVIVAALLGMGLALRAAIRDVRAAATITTEGLATGGGPV